MHHTLNPLMPTGLHYNTYSVQLPHGSQTAVKIWNCHSPPQSYLSSIYLPESSAPQSCIKGKQVKKGCKKPHVRHEGIL